MDEHTEVSQVAMTDIIRDFSKLIVICSFVSNLFSQKADSIAIFAEEIMQAYRTLNDDTTEELKRTYSDKDTTANSTHTPLFASAIFTDHSLSPVDKAVYSVLCARADNEYHQCSPKVKIIAMEASCSVRAVQNSLNTLEKRGIIRRKNRFINHRQISSLYTILGSQAESSREADTENEIQSNTSCSEMVSNPTEQKPTYFEGRNDYIGRSDEEGNDCTPLATNPVQSEKTLESLKNPYGGASLPASAEKNSEETPLEETKDSLTGGALLPNSPSKKQKSKEAPENITNAPETNPAKNPIIRAECDETTQANTTPTSVCKTPVIKAETANDTSYTTTDTPIPGTDEFYQWKYETSRKNCAEMLSPSKEPVSAVSGAMDVLAGILKNRVIGGESEVIAPIPVAGDIAPIVIKDETNTPDAREEHINADNAPADEQPVVKPQSIAVSDTPVAETHVMETRETPEARDEHMSVDNALADKQPAEMVKSPVATAKPAGKAPAPKKSSKGKSKVSRHPKELYSPADAPEIMRATAEYFLLKTGRVALRWEEIEVLRRFSATQYPAMVQKEIRRACARFVKRNQSLKCLTLMYVAAALEKRPTFGKKKKKADPSPDLKQYMPEEKTEYTEEEKAAVRAEIDRLQAKFDEEERTRCMRR